MNHLLNTVYLTQTRLGVTFRLIQLLANATNYGNNLFIVFVDSGSEIPRHVGYFAVAVISVLDGEAQNADVLVAIVAIQLHLLLLVLITIGATKLKQFLFQLGPERSDAVRSSLHFDSPVWSRTLLTQRLAAVDAVHGRWWSVGAVFSVQVVVGVFQTRLALGLAGRPAGGVAGVYQMLDEEMMLQTAQTVRRYLEPLPAQRTRQLISRLTVLKVTLEASEAKAVNAGQRLWVVEDFQTDGAGRPVGTD